MEPFDWAKKVFGLQGFVFDREVGAGQRFRSESLAGLKVDIWDTGKWSIVSRDVYGSGSLDLLMYLTSEAKNLRSIARTGRDWRAMSFLSIGLIETEGVSDIVAIHYKDNQEALQDARVARCRRKATTAYLSALDLREVA